MEKKKNIDRFIDASFLRDDVKQFYKQAYTDKLAWLKVLYSKGEPA